MWSFQSRPPRTIANHRSRRICGFGVARCGSNKRKLENDPAEKGEFLSEGSYCIDEEPLRAFFLIEVESMVVEVTDFRIL